MSAWVLSALSAALFGASVTVFAKVGLSQVDATLATTVRTLVMAIWLCSAVLATGKVRLLLSVDRRALLWILASGLAGAMSWLCYFWALKQGPASSVAAIDRLSVVFVMIFAAFWLAEVVTLRATIGALLLILGAILIALR